MTGLLIRDARRVPIAVPDPTTAEPVDVLVEDGTITEVGPALRRPPGVEEHDAAGRWVMPGLWDTHVHLGQWTLARGRLDTSEVRSPEEAVRLVTAKVAEQPGRPVIGWGHRPGTWSREPTTSDLDDAAGVTPVVLIAGDAHHAWLNRAAQAALGLPLREGVVAETEWFEAYERLTALTDTGDDPASYRRTLGDAAALGVVGLVDFEFTGGVHAWRERWSEGCDRLRVEVAVYADQLEPVLAEGLRTGDPLLPGEARLTMGPLKVISDGSLNTRTAWCHHPYATGAEPSQPAGAPNLAPAELTRLVGRAHAAGLEVATHAIGDAAVGAALTAYEGTGAGGSLEHVQLVTRGDVERMARRGLRASVQPHHLVDDRDLTEQVWPDRTDRCFAFRWLLDAGVPVSFGSDAPVSPLDPWLAIDAAVRRTGDDRPAWHGEQALTRREALAASVDGHLTVQPGAPGDLVVLDDDPLTAVRPGVALTVVAGAVVHRA
ncbi:amidohydrolase [Nocardioides antri]|uniref:Amidohydrolase family protein n=1 Tax=Nocardioides antri TaxID=2607659 RepID=A0A5B1M4M0_9ACTN|nr:amidohydrolase family protein [Nocardioides antri]KAA1427616.1 amidohydrolase family protein [Nocardioides antri]